MLDPDVVLRSATADGVTLVRGATVVEGRIVEIDILADRDQLRSLGIPGAAD